MNDFENLNLDMEKVNTNTLNHDELMQKHLQDKDYQRVYLETSLEEFANDGNIDAFIRSLQYVIKSRGRGAITSLAKELNMDRSNLSDILNGKVQPKISTTLKLINGLGYRIQLKTA
ncbi:helix-turn-helix domain-containing protein [bacterium]|nr:helix-turn-helix domain-containing protein [bacterium]